MRIKLNGKIHVLPDSWADVPIKHREALFSFLLLFEEKEAKILALQKMLSLSKGIFLRISAKDIAALIAQLTWFNLQPSATPILPFFKEKGTRYYFPKADFLNGTALEFMLIQELYNDFVKSDFDLNIFF